MTAQTTDPQVLLDLAVRCDAATEPDGYITADITHAVVTVGWDKHDLRWRDYDWPDYTASLDAAMTLVPDCHRAGVLHHALLRIQQTGFPNCTFLQRIIYEVLAAALRARAALLAQREGGE